VAKYHFRVVNFMKTQHLIPFLVFLLIVLGCQPSQTVLNDRQPTPEPVSESTPEVPVDDFQDRLKSVQTGGFDFVYALRRKDNGTFDANDKRFLKENTPQANQLQLTSDEKAVIVGTNYLIPPENLDALKKRFKIEDYSPKDEPKKEQNSNVNR
jgi:hypothetical protein